MADKAYSEKAEAFAKAPACATYLVIIALIKTLSPQTIIGANKSIGKASFHPLKKASVRPDKHMQSDWIN